MATILIIFLKINWHKLLAHVVQFMPVFTSCLRNWDAGPSACLLATQPFNEKKEIAENEKQCRNQNDIK